MCPLDWFEGDGELYAFCEDNFREGREDKERRDAEVAAKVSSRAQGISSTGSTTLETATQRQQEDIMLRIVPAILLAFLGSRWPRAEVIAHHRTTYRAVND